MLEVEYYTTADGRVPVEEWLEELGDDKTIGRVLARIDRLRQGNFGDHKSVGGGVFELRIKFGPGYRVYYAEVAGAVVVLLCGGDKSSQKRDIKLAKSYLADYEERQS